jgi:hypothetical protein
VEKSQLQQDTETGRYRMPGSPIAWLQLGTSPQLSLKLPGSQTNKPRPAVATHVEFLLFSGEYTPGRHGDEHCLGTNGHPYFPFSTFSYFPVTTIIRKVRIFKKAVLSLA